MTGKDGYFLAKYQMREALDHRLSVYEKELSELPHDSESVELHRALNVRIQEVKEFRNYIRNVMLWDIKQK